VSGEDTDPVMKFRDLCRQVDGGRMRGAHRLRQVAAEHAVAPALEHVAGELARASTRTLAQDSPVEPLRRPQAPAGVSARAVTWAHSGHWTAASRSRELRHGRVSVELSLVDDALVVVAGRPGTDGSRMLWGVVSPAFLDLSRLLWRRAWTSSNPCSHPGLTLSRRQMDIVSLVAEGVTIRGIARAIGASERVVSTELNLLNSVFGARDRASLVFRMCTTRTPGSA
jgi:DNA-binding CsgD family transcriptional regulator